jgi:drug/metabolite transporter (DMT)-like permease
MGAEWAEAGWGRRTVFVIAAIYWMTMVALAVASLPTARSAAEMTLVLGFYLVPLLYALIIRLAFVALSPRRPRPRVRSWWVLVIGALLGILVTVARVTVPAS